MATHDEDFARLREVVKAQAEDEGLWFIAATCSEAYLQQALRRLHELIEGKSADECARSVISKIKGV